MIGGQFQSEAYRRNCTSGSWVSEALAARILHAEKAWNHDAFFDYVDRWMTEDDTGHIQVISKAYGAVGNANSYWGPQRQALGDPDIRPFVNEMWKTYRNNLPAAASR